VSLSVFKWLRAITGKFV